MTNPNLTARRMLRLSALLEVLSAAGAAGAAGAAAAGTRSVLGAGATSPGKRLINNSLFMSILFWRWLLLLRGGSTLAPTAAQRW